MFDELSDRLNSLPAMRAARNDDSLAALSDAWGLVNETVPIVPAKFLLHGEDDCGVVHLRKALRRGDYATATRAAPGRRASRQEC